MARTGIHKISSIIKRSSPEWLFHILRRIGTLTITPIRFSYKSGHARSSLQAAAVSRAGDPIPWYTYPCIDFLKNRDFTASNILEFGSGQSTLFWSKRARSVISFEADNKWYNKIKSKSPENVKMTLVESNCDASLIKFIENSIQGSSCFPFDVIVIDGLNRSLIIENAPKWLSKSGMIICDNSEGFRIYETTREMGFFRGDFYGYAPGVLLPHCTSIFFTGQCAYFGANIPISSPQYE